MSNDVDVLLVGGTCDGEIVCMNREDTRIQLGNANYSPTPFEKEGKNYWVATPVTIVPEEVPTQEQINAAIDAVNFQPAWDLNHV